MVSFPSPPPPEWPPFPSEAEVLRVLRPADGSLVGELAITPAAEVARRVARVRTVQEGWASLDPGDRARRLKGLLRAMGDRAREIEDTIVAETGKPRVEALAEVVTILDLVRFYLRVAPAFLRPRKVPTGWMAWKRALVLREPLGVVGVISPWNYPFILSMGPVVTALFGGNGVVLKPSESTPYSGLLAEDLVRDAGLPEDLVQVVVGGPLTGEALVRSGVDKLFFTGGTGAGRRVMAAAADTLTPVVLELGGKDAAIVLEDAELERAASGVVWGAFQNAGQTCISVERVFVVEEVYEALLREVVVRVRRLRVGSAGGVDLGPITTARQLQAVEEQLEDARARGWSVASGGDRTDPASNVFLPTVLTGAGSDRESKVLAEETFGPLLPIIPVRDAEEAVRRANEGPFGLSASIWTRDTRRGMALAKRIRAGSVCVNDVMVNYGIAGLPFGGVGHSGFGRSRGVEGLEELTRTRSVVVDRIGLKAEPWWFPYDRKKEALFRAVVAFRWRGGLRGLVAGAAAYFRRRSS